MKEASFLWLKPVSLFLVHSFVSLTVSPMQGEVALMRLPLVWQVWAEWPHSTLVFPSLILCIKMCSWWDVCLDQIISESTPPGHKRMHVGHALMELWKSCNSMSVLRRLFIHIKAPLISLLVQFHTVSGTGHRFTAAFIQKTMQHISSFKAFDFSCGTAL